MPRCACALIAPAACITCGTISADQVVVVKVIACTTANGDAPGGRKGSGLLVMMPMSDSQHVARASVTRSLLQSLHVARASVTENRDVCTAGMQR